MKKIFLPTVGLEVDINLWSNLICQFSVENQYESAFLAKDFLELTVNNPDVNAMENINFGKSVEDSLDFVKFAFRDRFSKALREKYHIGNEFSDDEDASKIFDKAFVSAEKTAMTVLKNSKYTFDTLIYVELFYWVVLQLLRIDRGEYVDRKSQGNQVRLGDNASDLAGFDFYE